MSTSSASCKLYVNDINQDSERKTWYTKTTLVCLEQNFENFLHGSENEVMEIWFRNGNRSISNWSLLYMLCFIQILRRTWTSSTIIRELVWSKLTLASFPGSLCWCSSVWVQYITWKQKSGKKQGRPETLSLVPRLPRSGTQTLKLCRRGEPGVFCHVKSAKGRKEVERT